MSMTQVDLAKELIKGLPRNGDHIMVKFTAKHNTQFTMYAYRHFRAKGRNPCSFVRKPMTVDSPRELTGRIIVGCVRHGVPYGMPANIRFRTKRNRIERVVNRLYDAAVEDDERSYYISEIRRIIGTDASHRVMTMAKKDVMTMAKKDGINTDFLTMTMQEAAFLYGAFVANEWRPL